MHIAVLVAIAASAQALQLPLVSSSRASQVGPQHDVSKSMWPRPPGPPLLVDMTDYTIAEILNKSLTEGHPEPPPRGPHFPPPGPPHVLPLHRLAWLLNISSAEGLKEKLADPKANLTFIAPDDRALTPPPHHEHDSEHGPHRHHHRHSRDEGEPASPKPHPFHSRHILQSLAAENADADRSPSESDRKEFFKKLVGFILRYHLVPGGAYHPHELADLSTVASDLNGTRIRVEPKLFPTPALSFNFFVKTVGTVVHAKNGYIYLAGGVLLPPLPPLAELFVVPTVFSTLTSGVQKVELDLHTFHHGEHALDDEIHPMVYEVLDEIKSELPPAKHFTVFAPTNGAFRKLGWGLNGFLFSPFGRGILKAVLSYHVIPDVVFYSDYSVNATVSSTEDGVAVPVDRHLPSADLQEAGMLFHKPASWFRRSMTTPREVKVLHYSLKTLFNETVLPVDVYEYREGIFGRGPLKRDIWVGDGKGDKPGSRVKVVARDVPAFQGAIQVVDNLIRPPFPEHAHHDDEHHGHHEHGHHNAGEHEHGHHKHGEHSEMRRGGDFRYRQKKALRLWR